jgi:hypothetical protein
LTSFTEPPQAKVEKFGNSLISVLIPGKVQDTGPLEPFFKIKIPAQRGHSLSHHQDLESSVAILIYFQYQPSGYYLLEFSVSLQTKVE